MLDLDNIKSGEFLTDEQLKELLGQELEPEKSPVVGRQPAESFNPVTMKFEAVDEKIRELREKRNKLKEQNDPLEGKQAEMKRGLEEIGLSDRQMGKTGNSVTGEISEKHRQTAESQIEDAKQVMLYHRQNVR